VDGAVRVTLPGGRWVDGARAQEATLRPLVGHDEEALAGAGPALSAAAWTTDVLCRCLVDLGGTRPDGDAVRHLCVGDREALLWHLRRVTTGDRLDVVAPCEACGERLEVQLRVPDLLQPPYDRWAERFTEDLDGHRVVFRLPTGADQEEVAPLVAADPPAAAHRLLAACVLSVDAGPPTVDGFGAALAERLADLDPQAEALLALTCPACDHGFTVLLDAASYLAAELAQRSHHFYREVHSLAWHYHWGEAEILAMTPRRRARYLALIDETLRPGG
jgi:hypothetical protein